MQGVFLAEIQGKDDPLYALEQANTLRHVRADLEWIPDILAFELLREIRQIHGKISVRLCSVTRIPVKWAFVSRPTSILIGPSYPSLERLQLGRPEYVTGNSLGAGTAAVSNEVGSGLVCFRRKRCGAGKHSLELGIESPIERCLPGGKRQHQYRYQQHKTHTPHSSPQLRPLIVSSSYPANKDTKAQ